MNNDKPVLDNRILLTEVDKEQEKRWETCVCVSREEVRCCKTMP